MKLYKKLVISIDGNRKTSNAIDIVRGCQGAKIREKGCYESCYACKMARISNVKFNEPVINELNEKKLRKQLANNTSTWIRIGTNGDPSLAWDTTIRVSELCTQEGKQPLIMTKVWRNLTKTRLIKLAAVRAYIQVGLSALDTEQELKVRKQFIENYAQYYKHGTIVKIMTLPFEDKRLAEMQENLVNYAKKYRFMELPLRIFKNVSYTNQVDWSKMRHHISPFTGKSDTSWTVDPLYLPENFDKSIQATNDGKYILCPETTCHKCPNKCGTIF